MDIDRGEVNGTTVLMGALPRVRAGDRRPRKRLLTLWRSISLKHNKRHMHNIAQLYKQSAAMRM